MTVVVCDPDPDAVEEQCKAVEQVVQGRGFVAVSETLNAVEAWLSSVPGHCYANVRQALVSTLNLAHRSEEHTSELQSLMRISYAVFCLKKKKQAEHKQKA